MITLQGKRYKGRVIKVNFTFFFLKKEIFLSSPGKVPYVQCYSIELLPCSLKCVQCILS